MTAPTPTTEQLRTPQPPTEFNVNRDWLTKLTLTEGGRIRRNESGRDMLRAPQHTVGQKMHGSGGFATSLGAKMRTLWAAGAAVLGEEGCWELTDHGRDLKTQAEQHYAATRITAGR